MTDATPYRAFRWPEVLEAVTNCVPPDSVTITEYQSGHVAGFARAVAKMAAYLRTLRRFTDALHIEPRWAWALVPHKWILHPSDAPSEWYGGYVDGYNAGTEACVDALVALRDSVEGAE